MHKNYMVEGRDIVTLREVVKYYRDHHADGDETEDDFREWLSASTDLTLEEADDAVDIFFEQE